MSRGGKHIIGVPLWTCDEKKKMTWAYDMAHWRLSQEALVGVRKCTGKGRQSEACVLMSSHHCRQLGLGPPGTLQGSRDYTTWGSWVCIHPFPLSLTEGWPRALAPQSFQAAHTGWEKNSEGDLDFVSSLPFQLRASLAISGYYKEELSEENCHFHQHIYWEKVTWLHLSLDVMDKLSSCYFQTHPVQLSPRSLK